MYEKVALRSQFACCSITIAELNASSLDVFLTWSLPTSRRLRANNANGRPRRRAAPHHRKERTLTFSSTWRFRVDTCKSCIQLCSSIKYELFLLIIISEFLAATGFHTCEYCLYTKIDLLGKILFTKLYFLVINRTSSVHFHWAINGQIVQKVIAG